LQLSVNQRRKLEARVGARITEEWTPEVTHLVTDTFRSTLKLMCSVCVGAHIVMPSYLDACEQAGGIVDEASHLLRDELCEAAFAKKRGLGNYSLQAAVELARQRPLLAGVDVSCSESVARQPELEAIVRAAGGRWEGSSTAGCAQSSSYDCVRPRRSLQIGPDGFDAELLREAACTQLLRLEESTL
jgi:hypothetical protein